jgi:putative ABC transport system permease protein
MSGFLQDLRYGARALRHNPGTTLVAVISLALGIGAPAVVFTVVNTLLLKPLPVEDPGRLVRLGATKGGRGFGPFTYPEYVELRDGTESFSGVAMHFPTTVVFNDGVEPTEQMMELVSGNYFDVLGLSMPHGRGFLPDEDRTPGTHPVVVLGDQVWRRQFAADPGVVGQTVKVNGQPLTVIGVAPPEFRGTFAGFDVALWVPVMMHDQVLHDDPDLYAPDFRFAMLSARLAPGATRDEARGELAVIARRLGDERGAGVGGSDFGIVVTDAGGVHPFVASLMRAFLALLMGMVGLVLLIACANVASLMLARAAVRRREIAVRMAIGAGRLRIARQSLIESLLLALTGGAGGFLIAVWASRAISAVRLPVTIPVALDLSVDWVVFGFTLATCLGATLVFGMAPALQAMRTDVAATMASAGRSGSARRGLLGRSLVLVQVAVSTVLLTGALLMGRSLLNSRKIDPGFDAANVVVVMMETGQLGLDEARVRAFWRDLHERLDAIPGVQAVTAGLFVPLGDRADQVPVRDAAAAPASGEERDRVFNYSYVEPGYFRTLGFTIEQGREFASGDTENAPDVGVINRALADQLFPGASPLGRRMVVTGRDGPGREVEVIGIVANAKLRSLGADARPFLFLPTTQWYRPDLTFFVRTAGDPTAAVTSVRDAVRAANRELPAQMRTLEDAMGFTLVPARIAGVVLGGAGLVGIVLAAIGLFGIMTHSVTRRMREIGIRMALGADPRKTRAMVVGQGLRVTLAGTVIGLVLALGASRLLQGLLYGMGPSDPLTFAATALLLIAVGTLASAGPARRATRVDPAVVLREE